MCGRYALRRDIDDLVTEFEVDPMDAAARDALAAGATRSTNVAPTTTPPVVLERVPRGRDGTVEDAPPTRQLRALRWGLVPSWTKDAGEATKGAARMINARAESLLTKPAFAKAALTRRCLVPVDAWYEWQVSPTVVEGGKPRKQPFAVRATDGSVLSLGGVYEFWRDPARPDDDPARWWVTFAVVTTAAEPGLDRLHERMPLVVPRDLRDAWLDPSLGEREDVEALLAALPRDLFSAEATGGPLLDAHPVPRRVGNVRVADDGLLDPAPPAELDGAVDLRTGELLGTSA
ncbi:SOS response-associated peptidase [Kineococcus gynurae]|uniref:Abasic site processing protein n=1 Tax=Kineococcus gynurae TaxID=452979 RepID=A0ABV5LN17_9ACTN